MGFAIVVRGDEKHWPGIVSSAISEKALVSMYTNMTLQGLLSRRFMCFLTLIMSLSVS
jgi:hypothetical protein